MLQRLILAFTFAVLVGYSALVFEAASRTAIAVELIERARVASSPQVARQLLGRAETGITQSWARPALWHAGASEALSGAYLLHGQAEADERLLRESARWAAHAVRLAPVQPNAWIRLALLAEAGQPNPVCTAAACLEKAWQSAPVLSGESACARMRLTHRLGQLSEDDLRLVAFVRTARSPREAARCLSFLAPEQLYEVLMAARQAPS